VQGVEHRVCDIQRVPPPARCTIDRTRQKRWRWRRPRGSEKRSERFYPDDVGYTATADLLPVTTTVTTTLLPLYVYYTPLPLLPRRCCCCLCAVPLCIRRKTFVEYSRRRCRHRVRRESLVIFVFTS